MKCFKIKKYPLGDFSFIKNEIERKSMEFDYRVYNRIKVKSAKKEKNVDVISKMNYSDESYINNIKNLSYIEKHGWNNFVENYPTIIF